MFLVLKIIAFELVLTTKLRALRYIASMTDNVTNKDIKLSKTNSMNVR